MNTQNILKTARAIQQIRFIEPKTLTFKAGHTGTVIALFPSFQVAQMLSKFGSEEAKDLHITLAFLGETSEIQDTSMLLDVISVLAKDYLPMSGKINGVGRFNMFDPQKQDVFIALPDIPALPLFRQNTFEFIKELGFTPLEDHGFTPHITLSYLQENESIPTEMIPPFSLQFNDVSVVLGEDRYDFPFGDRSMATRSGARNSRIDLKRIQDTHDLCVDLGARCKAEYQDKSL